MIVNVVKR